MRLLKPEELNENVFNAIGREWMLITAGRPEHFNTMTASWGGLGFFLQYVHFHLHSLPFFLEKPSILLDRDIAQNYFFRTLAAEFCNLRYRIAYQLSAAFLDVAVRVPADVQTIRHLLLGKPQTFPDVEYVPFDRAVVHWH